jgi:hypothetical protein
MRKGRPDFVPIEDIGQARDCLACVLDRFQHGRIGFISVHQRIDPIARQQGSLYHTPNDPSQHLKILSVIRQMTLQLFGQTFGLCGLCPVAFKVPSQQSGLMANAIDSEDEVHDSPDQGHEPNETYPRDGGTRITFFENRVPSRQHRENQPKSDCSDVPDVVRQITKGRRHCGLSLRLLLFVFMAHLLRGLDKHQLVLFLAVASFSVLLPLALDLFVPFPHHLESNHRCHRI